MKSVKREMRIKHLRDAKGLFNLNNKWMTERFVIIHNWAEIHTNILMKLYRKE